MHKKFFLLLLLFCSSFLLTSCLDRDVYVKVSKDQFFDFSLEQEITLSIDYGFSQQNYIVLFGIYDQNPTEENENGTLVKKDIEPIYRAATDGKGKFNQKITIAASISEVWLYSEYLGTLSPVKLEITDHTIKFNQKEYLQKVQTRAVTSNKHTYPDNWLTLGDWNQYGTPDYTLPDLQMPSASTLYTINEIFVKYNKIPLKDRYKQFFTGQPSADVRIIKPTKVNLTFINSTASMRNTVGYFTYPTNNPPTDVSQITKILAYPSATPYVRVSGNTETRGALLSGQQIQLKYWDGTRFHDEFPAGISIGWFLEANAFQLNGNIVPQGYAPCRYSLSHLNVPNVQRTVSLRDPKTDRIVAIAFEDQTDFLYNDATFYLGVEESGAIDPSTPTLPDDGNAPDDEENYTTYFGTLAFEDLWTATGDYDMNDVLIDYTCKVYKQIIGNKVYKLVDEFTPRHKGGSLQSGFGYQLHKITADYIRKITVESDGLNSKYMEGQTLEPGQSHPTILLFDEVSQALGKKIKVTIELSDAASEYITPPYNPFIFTHSEEGREREVHLPMYPPTDKADMSLFGTGRDGSRPQEEMYYVTAMWQHQYPYALNMSSVKDFPIQPEAVRIDKSYPKFQSWVESKGSKDKDWYKHPALN